MEYFSAKKDIGASQKSSKIGLALIAATGGIATAISVVCFPFVSPAFRRICLPYVPATHQQIKNVIQALNGRSGSLIDLGSGDGRIVLAAAKHGFKAHGIELNTWLVWYSRLKALTNGLSNNTAFFKQDLWKYNLGKYDNIVVFGVDQMMEDIEKKFNSELCQDTLVIACRFPLPNKHPIMTIGHGVDTVWVYKISQS
ncbi:ATP synthase subunit C lysine N-methyltransferase [Linepithema humile]|uniref:ATP synthase subunit C lysine N-methyltransferase n=1 Tax=Linepithema humile TaxID=83485 RepID=UPI0006239735|nr:PREDICTED: protein FAM173B [Linepithema humile]XP_012224352.1 PREDICTED: protein FAM173B [Linepithema humile]